MRVFNSVIILSILIVFSSCEKENSTKNDAKLLGITLSSGTASIDTANKKILLKIPDATDISSIIPHFNISPNATIYPPSDVATNFSNPVIYTITSQDESRKYVFTVSAVKQIAKITIYDCSNWSPAATKALLPGAVIKIYSNEQDFNNSKTYDLLTTDQNANADFYGEKGKSYLVTVNKDSKSNIINGYVLEGRYDDQSEIQNSPTYANAVVGGLKFKDVNGDWRVQPEDRYNFDRIYVYTSFTGIKLIDLYVSNPL